MALMVPSQVLTCVTHHTQFVLKYQIVSSVCVDGLINYFDSEVYSTERHIRFRGTFTLEDRVLVINAN